MEAFDKHKKKQPDKNVICSSCGKNINLQHNYGYYFTTWDKKYQCEDCYYGNKK